MFVVRVGGSEGMRVDGYVYVHTNLKSDQGWVTDRKPQTVFNTRKYI